MTTSLGATQLEALLESAQLLHATLDLDALLRHLLRSVMGRLLVSRALIAVRRDGEMRIALARGLPQVTPGAGFDEEAARAAGIEIVLPIGEDAAPVGFLGIGSSSRGALSDDEMGFVRALLGLAASGIQNAHAHSEARQLNRDLDQKVQDLRTLLDMVRGLTAALEADEVARLLMLTLTGRWMVRRYALVAWKDGHPPVLRQKGMDLGGMAADESAIAGLGAAADGVTVARLPAGALKVRLAAAEAEAIFPIRAGGGGVRGFVALGPRPGQLAFDAADLDFGAGLVAQAAVAFENAWHFRETLDKKKLERELELAASIQSNLFPAELPRVAGYELAVRNRPARQCGGDYYDVLPVPGDGGDERLLLCVADVSGKGLPASLLMSNMQATLRALLGRFASLADLAAHANDLLYATTSASKYVTAALLELVPASGAATYVSAGHTDCLLLRASGEAEWLDSTGTPLGLLPSGLPYGERRIGLAPGDCLALFSDGVTEAQNRADEEFGEERLAEIVRSSADAPAETIVARIFDAIDAFAGDAPQFDDITLLVIKRQG